MKLKDGVKSCGALFSPCRKYRYQLWRIWDESLPMVTFIGLNPSTADETIDDPTVAKCQRYARRWGYGGIFMANIFAFRATDPSVMKSEREPIGPGNDEAILDMIRKSRLVICAWGNHGQHRNRSLEIKRLLNQSQPPCGGNPGISFLQMNISGEPAHPLYLKGYLNPTPWVSVQGGYFE